MYSGKQAEVEVWIADSPKLLSLYQRDAPKHHRKCSSAKSEFTNAALSTGFFPYMRSPIKERG